MEAIMASLPCHGKVLNQASNTEIEAYGSFMDWCYTLIQRGDISVKGWTFGLWK